MQNAHPIERTGLCHNQITGTLTRPALTMLALRRTLLPSTVSATLGLLLTACPTVGVEDDYIGDGDATGTSSDTDDGTDTEEESTGTDTTDDGTTDTTDDTTDDTDDTTTDGTTDGTEETSSDTGPWETCDDITQAILELGTIDIQVDVDHDLVASCGADGADAVFEFTAPQAGDYRFSVANFEFSPVLYVVNECMPLDEIACEDELGQVDVTLEADQLVYVVVDSAGGTGSAELTAELL